MPKTERETFAAPFTGDVFEDSTTGRVELITLAFAFGVQVGGCRDGVPIEFDTFAFSREFEFVVRCIDIG